MAMLKNYNGYYCESDYEYAFIRYLEAEEWSYASGNSLSRASRRDVLDIDDIEKFLSKTNPDLIKDEIDQNGYFNVEPGAQINKEVNLKEGGANPIQSYSVTFKLDITEETLAAAAAEAEKEQAADPTADNPNLVAEPSGDTE